MLDVNSPVPLYEQIKEDIKDKIRNKEWKEYRKVPAEAELVERYQVSRVTVRKALALLVEEGYLEKKQGIGTFVAQPRIQERIQYSSSFTRGCLAAGMHPGCKVLKKEILEGNHKSYKKLGIGPKQKVLHLERLRFADEEPVSLENMYFSFDKYGFLLWEDLTGSIYSIFEQRLNIDLAGEDVRHRGILSVEKAGTRYGNLFHIAANEPVFVLDTVVSLGTEVIYTGRDYCLGSRYCYEIQR